MTPEEHVEKAEELLDILGGSPTVAPEWNRILAYRAEIHLYAAQVRLELADG